MTRTRQWHFAVLLILASLVFFSVAILTYKSLTANVIILWGSVSAGFGALWMFGLAMSS